MSEEWRDIKDYEGLYQVSNLGNVKSIDRVIHYLRGDKEVHRAMKGKPLCPAIMNSGYYELSLSKEAKISHYLVHRLVASAFLSNTKKLKCVNHKNGNKLDNTTENLEWISYSDNNVHAFKNGLNKCNEDHGRAKLTNEEVREIRSLIKDGISQRQIAFAYGVNHNTVHLIKTGKNWKYLK